MSRSALRAASRRSFQFIQSFAPFCYSFFPFSSVLSEIVAPSILYLIILPSSFHPYPVPYKARLLLVQPRRTNLDYRSIHKHKKKPHLICPLTPLGSSPDMEVLYRSTTGAPRQGFFHLLGRTLRYRIEIWLRYHRRTLFNPLFYNRNNHKLSALMIQASSQVMFRDRLQELPEKRMSCNANTVPGHSKDLGRGVT